MQPNRWRDNLSSSLITLITKTHVSTCSHISETKSKVCRTTVTSTKVKVPHFTFVWSENMFSMYYFHCICLLKVFKTFWRFSDLRPSGAPPAPSHLWCPVSAQFLGQLVLDREHLHRVESVWDHRVTLWRKVTAHLQPPSQEETGNVPRDAFDYRRRHDGSKNKELSYNPFLICILTSWVFQDWRWPPPHSSQVPGTAVALPSWPWH